MSRENVEVVIGVFENTNARDFAAVMEAYADDIVLVLHGKFQGLGGGAVGKKAVGEWFGDWFSQFDADYRFELEESRDLGDRVFVVATHHGRGRSSGATVQERMAYLYEVRERQVRRVEVWDDREAAIQAMITSSPRDPA